MFKNTKRGATEWFHEPATLLEMCGSEKVRRRRNIFAEQDFSVKSVELELFERHASEMFQQIDRHRLPEVRRLRDQREGVQVLLPKCFIPDDLKPSSSLRSSNRDRIVLQGQHDFGSDGLVAAATPNQIFDWILARHGQSKEKPDDWITRRYKAAVHDRNSLAQFRDDHMVDMVAPPATSATPAWIEKLLGGRDTDLTPTC